MSHPVRLIVDPPAAGPWNMAVDEALLASVAPRGEPTLRLYRWEQPTLSLGYFQRVDQRQAHPPSYHCPLVRRSSGGGAIVHDRELTYSFVLPTASCRRPGAAGLYETFHETLIEALRHWSIAARLCPTPRQRSPAEEPFLCFQRRAAGDLLVGEVKVVGSAQRRHRQGLLQHGSILWERSPQAPELPGLLDVADRKITLSQLIDQWLRPLAGRLDAKFVAGQLAPEERAVARSRAADRFGHPGWTFRR